jgi:eukaryotic translation initiation factor 2C
VPVSYASPTYYADRLCERGRLYLRNFFLGRDSEVEKELAEVKKEEEKKRTPAPQSATDEQKRAHKKQQLNTLDDALKKKTLELAQTRFGQYRDRNDSWVNPWQKELGQTMFWL